jgi:hypothetical protein
MRPPTAPRDFAFGLTRCACQTAIEMKFTRNIPNQKGDISILEKRGHFNFALTGQGAGLSKRLLPDTMSSRSWSHKLLNDVQRRLHGNSCRKTKYHF